METSRDSESKSGNKEPGLSNLIDFQHKVDSLVFVLNIKKSKVIIEEISIK